MEAVREISQEGWSEYFDSLSKELLGAPVSIEIRDASEPPAVEARRLPLQTLTYDRRGDVFEVAAGRNGAHLPSVLRHFVDHPQRVFVDNEVMLAPITISVEASDGGRTLIRIEYEPEFTG